MIGGTEIWAGMYKYVGVKHASGVSSGATTMARREAPFFCLRVSSEHLIFSKKDSVLLSKLDYLK